MTGNDGLWPNLFIVGPHKTGTTTWWRVLDQHPEVCMALAKEPHWLNQDHHYTTRPVESEEAYLRLFRRCRGALRRGDASPWYFASEAACRAIRERAEDPRVLIALRDPVERLYSLHSNRIRGGREPLQDLRAVLEAEPARRRGEGLPERLAPRRSCFYRENLAYTPHVRRYLDAFEEHELKILKFETYIRDVPATYRELCRWIGVDPDFEPTLERSNPNAEIRSAWFRDRLREPPRVVTAFTGLFPLEWRYKLRDRLKRVNQRPTEREPLDPALEAALRAECLEDVEALEELLGWDLSDWKPGDAPPAGAQGGAS